MRICIQIRLSTLEIAIEIVESIEFMGKLRATIRKKTKPHKLMIVVLLALQID